MWCGFRPYILNIGKACILVIATFVSPYLLKENVSVFVLCCHIGLSLIDFSCLVHFCVNVDCERSREHPRDIRPWQPPWELHIEAIPALLQSIYGPLKIGNKTHIFVKKKEFVFGFLLQFGASQFRAMILTWRWATGAPRAWGEQLELWIVMSCWKLHFQSTGEDMTILSFHFAILAQWRLWELNIESQRHQTLKNSTRASHWGSTSPPIVCCLGDREIW